MFAAIMAGAFLAALVIIAAVLMVLRGRASPSTMTAALKQRAARASSTSTFDAGAALIPTLSAPIHGASDGGCNTAHSGSVDCGSHGGS